VKNITLGVIGAGMIAEAHIKHFQSIEGVRVKWLASRGLERINYVKELLSIPHFTQDYRQILADPEVDAVLIAAPPAAHKQQFIDCLRAKKHVLLEKPAAISMAELDMMQAEMELHPECIVVDCSCRHSRLQPKFKLIKEWIDAGKLGEIYFIHHNGVFRQGRPGVEYHPTAKWFLNKKISGGGPMLDWGVYDLSFHLGLLSDKPQLEKVVHAFAKNKLDNVDAGTDVYDVEEHAAALMTFSGGLTYYWERGAQANVEVPNETRIYGTKGGVKLAYCSWDAPEIEFFDLIENGNKAHKEVVTADYTNHVEDLYQLDLHFINVLRGQELAQMTFATARKHLEIIFEVYKKAGI